MIYRLAAGTELSTTLINRSIEHNRVEAARRVNLYNYYNGKQAIVNRTYSDTSKPNNRIVNPYAHYITDTICGYFAGKPVTYQTPDTEFEQKLTECFKYNDEAAENAKLAQDCSICGVAYELLWCDEEGELRFTSISPVDGIAIYDTELAPEMLYFIRDYHDYDMSTLKDVEYVEVYSRTDYKLYKRTTATLELMEQRNHSFGLVPVVEYDNNTECNGDFELVTSLIDSYDSLTSDNINDADYLADAYLILKGMMGTTSEDVSSMKENRVLLLDTDASAEWLTKGSGSDTSVETLKTRIETDIHKFSGVPDMSDENFAANASGVAMKYKLLGLENVTAKKEREFKRSLQKRLEIICSYYNLLGSTYDYTDVDIIFNRNLPANMEEIASTLNSVGHLLSTETQLSMLPLDIDVKQEMERKAEEDAAGYAEYNFTGDGLDA